MIHKIQGEQPFQVLASNFSIGPSNEGYTLQISSDGKNYSDLFSVGANVTRMVTGVANGSFYRLSGNASEVAINWREQCSDGGSGGGTGPQGPAGPQGPQGPAGEPASGAGDSYILLPSSALPEYVITDYVWETWADDTYNLARETCTNNGDYLMHWDNSEKFKGVVITGGAFSPTQGYGMEMGEDGKMHCTDSNYPDITAWIEDGKLYWNNPYGVISMLDAYGVGSDKEGGIYTEYTIIPDAAGSIRATSAGTYQVIDGEWKQLGGYDVDGALCYWNPETGYTAEWLSPLTSLDTNEGDGLIYAEIPENQVLFEARQSSSEWVKAVYTKDTLSFVNSADTVLSAITLGSDFEIQLPGSTTRKLIGTFQKHYIGLRKNYSNISFQNVWDGSVNGGHYELTDKTNYRYVEASNGIPKWNNKGQIIGKERGVSATDFYVNTTASTVTQRTTLYGDGTMHLPSRIFVPTNGGSEGQVLTSAGENAEPVWATMIKALQITSADYEALAVKDPNTLYLIVD